MIRVAKSKLGATRSHDNLPLRASDPLIREWRKPTIWRDPAEALEGAATETDASGNTGDFQA